MCLHVCLRFMLYFSVKSTSEEEADHTVALTKEKESAPKEIQKDDPEKEGQTESLAKKLPVELKVPTIKPVARAPDTVCFALILTTR